MYLLKRECWQKLKTVRSMICSIFGQWEVALGGEFVMGIDLAKE